MTRQATKRKAMAMSGEEGETSVGTAEEVVIPEAEKIGELIVQSPEFIELRDGLLEMYRQAHGVHFDLTKTKDNESARKLRKLLVTSRTEIERRRLDGNRRDRESVADRIAKRDELAQILTDAVRALETPIDDAIRADEERREREREEARQREEARIAGLRQRVDDITSVAVRAVDLPSAEIEAKLALVGRIEIGEDFEEFQTAATAAKADTMSKLADLLGKARDRERQAEEAERNRLELEQLRAENAAREAREKAEREQREAAERAEAQRRAAAEAEQRRLEQEAAQRRQTQMRAVQDTIGQIQREQQRAITATADGLLNIIARVREISAPIDCGDFAGQWEYARDSAVEQLTELAAQKREQEAEREAERVRREREAEIARNFEAFTVVDFAGVPDEQFQIRAAIEAVEAVVVDAERFGDKAGIAEQAKAGTLARLNSKLARAMEPRPEPPPPPPAPPEPVVIAIDPAVDGPDQTIEVIRDALPLDDGGQDVEDDRHMAAHYALLNAAAQICKAAKPKTKAAAEWLIPATLMEGLRNSVRGIQMPGGGYYAGDGTLMNADGTRSIFDDVDEGGVA